MKQHQIHWKPSNGFVKQSHLKGYEKWLADYKGLRFSSYEELWEWSVRDIETFWESLWHYFSIQNHAEYSSVTSSQKMPGVNWFNGAELNYAEHIFRMKSEGQPALIFASESGIKKEVSWAELEQKVAAVRAFLVEQGIEKGDRVAAYIPNIPEAIFLFLAVNSLGAVWSCCSPDFGVRTVIDRFSQIEPDILFAATGYYYNGKVHSRVEEIKQIEKNLSGLQKTVFIPYATKDKPKSNERDLWGEIISWDNCELTFEPVEFNHPIWVLYSSGTTGKPKAITHSHGGVLLEHLKYMHFHNDVHPGENFFWFTTTGWMMWNFLQASLLAGATAVLYDGSPAHPNLNTLWKLAEKFPIHHFGTSAPYLVACMKEGLNPGDEFDLSMLRSIGSTGAPLPPEAFDWVYQSVSKNVWLCSMSGGTDVCTAFVGGIPSKPVKRGLIQGRALGCGLKAYNEQGEEVFDSLGEMVVEKPMPSMPVYFWGDENNARYKASYFEQFEGKWCHGDWIKLFKDGQLVIQGRSDATLNRKGIRIGTAEIYSIVNKVPGIKDSLIVNIEHENGEDFMPLFVMLNEGVKTNDIENRVKKNLKEDGSPRHIPDQIIAVDDIPYTLSGKKMEVPVKKVLMGMEAGQEMNKDAIRNPQAMEFFIEFGKHNS